MMTWHTLRTFLGWSIVGHYAVLLLWFTVFAAAHDWLYRLHRHWFQLTPAQFDALHYAGMAIYKIGVLLLFVVPWLVLMLLI